MNYNNPYKLFANFARSQGEFNIAHQFEMLAFTEQLSRKDEHDKLVKEITDEVLSRLSLTLDANTAIKQINALNNAINNLGNK